MINIVVDFVLVGYFHMGAKGAAIATVSAQGFSFLFALVYLCKKGIGYSLMGFLMLSAIALGSALASLIALNVGVKQ